jgi:hypothetical protein
MNFLIRENTNYNFIEENREIVIIELNEQQKTEKVYLHFPENRFVNFKEKRLDFINKISGIFDEKNNCILTGTTVYEIYEIFYSVFY